MKHQFKAKIFIWIFFSASSVFYNRFEFLDFLNTFARF